MTTMLRVDQYSRRTKKLVAARAAANASKESHLSTTIVTAAPTISRPRTRSIEQVIEAGPEVFEKLENMLIANCAEVVETSKPRDRPSHRRMRTCFVGGDVFGGMSNGASSSLGPQNAQVAIRVVD